MTCKDAIDKLSDYLDSELTPSHLGEFEAHLFTCAACRGYLGTYRKTKELAAKVNRVEVPEHLRTRLLQLLAGSKGSSD